MAWESVRSDSHGVVFRVGTDALWMQGSPARVIGDGCNVFGAGASAQQDIKGCVQRMANFLFGALPIDNRFPVDKWIVSRVDVTKNLDVGDLGNVRSALSILRNLEGGRYRVSQQAGDTVYWSHKSRLRSGKAYAKGPHLLKLNKSRSYMGKIYNQEEIELANRLLRLELKLGPQFWRERAEKRWFEWTAKDFDEQWESYFGRMIGTVEMVNDSEVKKRVLAVAPSVGQGKAAYGCWAMIQAQGWERAREMYSRSSWYRHLSLLRRAGLGDADFSAGRVVHLRRKLVEARVVNSWSELQRAA